MKKQEFFYAFQITKLVVFEVDYYTLGSNSAPYFSTSAHKLIRSKRDYIQQGQVQESVLPHNSEAYEFYKKWDKYHLKELTEKEYEELAQDIEKLKDCYNYIFVDCGKSTLNHIAFYDIAELIVKATFEKEIQK